MRGATDALLEEAIAKRAGEGPADVVDLCPVAREVVGPAFARREGEIHALVHRMVREGSLAPAGRSPSGATRYAAGKGKGDPPGSSEPGIDAPPPAPRAASKSAVAVASGARDAEDRGRIAADVLAHLADIAADGASGGSRRFGRASQARALVRRVDRGRKTLCVAVGAKEATTRFLVHEGPGFLAAAVVFGLAWLFLVEPRRIPSRSMEPTLRPGDRVVVWKPVAGREPPRWAVVVFRREVGDVYVKRVVGLPGESIEIDSDGDARVAGKILVKPDDVREAVREPLVRSTWPSEGVPEWWAAAPDLGPQAFRLWRLLFADEPRSSDEAALTFESSERQVHDVYVDAVIAPNAQAAAEIRIDWAHRRGTRPRVGASGLRLRLERSGRRTLVAEMADGTTEVLDAADGPASDASGDAALSLSYVDGVVRARVGAWAKRLEAPSVAGIAHVAVLGSVRSVAIDRDLHYTLQGSLATDMPFKIDGGHVFCLGDHSFNSKDSRFAEVGPVLVSSIGGRVVFRIWPPSRVGPIH